MKCSQMKLGQVYVCSDCGLELKVVRECSCTEDSCACEDTTCCGSDLALKE